MENQNIENQNGENQQNQQPQQGEQKHQNPGNNRPTGGQQQQERMFTQSELNAIVGHRVSETKEKYEKKIEELSKQIEELKTGSEELKKKAENYDALLEKYRTEKIQTHFKEKARENNIEYIDAAMKLIKEELFALEINENGEVEGLDDLVKKLVEENPFLVKKQEQPKPVGLPSNPSGRVDKSKEQLLKEAYEKAKRTGKKEDLLAYSRLKRELNN